MKARWAQPPPIVLEMAEYPVGGLLYREEETKKAMKATNGACDADQCSQIQILKIPQKRKKIFLDSPEYVLWTP